MENNGPIADTAKLIKVDIDNRCFSRDGKLIIFLPKPPPKTFVFDSSAVRHSQMQILRIKETLSGNSLVVAVSRKDAHFYVSERVEIDLFFLRKVTFITLGLHLGSLELTQHQPWYKCCLDDVSWFAEAKKLLYHV